MNLRTRLTLILVGCSFLFVGCSNNSQVDGFSDGHKFKGRYVNTQQGIHSFTFQTDGTFTRGGAVSGDFYGGDYVSSSHESGTYHLNGKNLKVTYENGDTEDLPIEIFNYNAGADYSQETPTQLRIDNVTYITSSF